MSSRWSHWHCSTTDPNRADSLSLSRILAEQHDAGTSKAPRVHEGAAREAAEDEAEGTRAHADRRSSSAHWRLQADVGAHREVCRLCCARACTRRHCRFWTDSRGEGISITLKWHTDSKRQGAGHPQGHRCQTQGRGSSCQEISLISL